MIDAHAAHERAALLALLTQRPALLGEAEGATPWPVIASELLLRGSAIALWNELHPPQHADHATNSALAQARSTLD